MGKSPTMDMAEIRRRVEALGARFEQKGDRVAIYPADRDQPPVFLTLRHTTTRDLTEALRRLHRSGLDIENMSEETPAVKPTPAVLAAPRINGHAASPKIDPRPTEEGEALLAMLAEADRKIAQLRDDLAAETEIRRAAEDRLDAVERRHTEAMRRLVGRVEALEARVAPKSRAQLTREAVLAFFEGMPRVKMSPQLVTANLQDRGDLPEGARAESAAVAQACADLARAGKLQGGGQKGTGQTQTTRGIYWYEPAPDPD